MKTHATVLLFAFYALTITYSQTPAPFLPDANTVALWHFDEMFGAFVQDVSGLGNHGNAIGTTIDIGRFGNARVFNGFSDYIYVSDPANGSLDFGTNRSFSVDVWFKTTTLNGILLRKGLAPTPGYNLLISNGHVQGEIGNREDSHYPDTLVRIRSQQTYNDGQWHVASLERDRAARTITLYVDGAPAAPSVYDPITFPLWSDRPLTLGKWETNASPTYYEGLIDEVRISSIARHAPPVVNDTVGLWHFNENTGHIVSDSSPYGNDGNASGTTIVQGRFGNARGFNGSYSYVFVPYQDSSMNFAASQSFTVQLWFKTTQQDTGEMIRRGLAPTPGFALRILNGSVQGIVGYQEPYLRITSDRSDYNDGQWHLATMVRDRAEEKLFLYVDGAQATAPLEDVGQNAIANDRPLTMGAWESFAQPTFYQGVLDEVGIFKGARHPIEIGAPAIQLEVDHIDFGHVLLGTNATVDLVVRNIGSNDTLFLAAQTNNPVFQLNVQMTYHIPPGSARNVPVVYSPAAALTDTGAMTISSNDPNRPIVRVSLAGRGVALGATPVITSITDVVEDQGKQVRVMWYRSLFDSGGNTILAYDLWRKVAGNSDLCDFIVTVPAVHFTQYSYVAPTLYNSTVQSGIRWSVFRVSARTGTGGVYFSDPDSGYSIDNIPPLRPTNLFATVQVGRVTLGWDQPTDPDIIEFTVYRSSVSNFLPSELSRIGSTIANIYVDQNIAGSDRWYYRVTAVDSGGNESEFSDEVFAVVTSVSDGDQMPIAFALYQNFPNPFNPSSIIRYDVPHSSHVQIRVFDMLGREVATLVNELRTAGQHDVNWNAQDLSSGVYFCRMQAGDFITTQKMVLLK